MSYASEELTIVWLLLITVVVATYFIQSYKIKLLPPSSSAILLGIFFGIITRIAGLSSTLRFSPAAFFYALLPPIVFNAGFTLRRKGFFDNLGTILAFAIVGTFISALVFGLGTYILVLFHIVSRSHLGGAPFIECLMYGAAISSIDPVATLAVLAQTDVPPILYNLVFGESVLNDAVAIVLFRSLSTVSGSSFGLLTLPGVIIRFCILLVGSLVIGVGVALATAFLLKRFEAYYSTPNRGVSSSSSPHILYTTNNNNSNNNNSNMKHPIDPTVYEIAIVIMSAYLAYLVAEVVGMSGIVALFFTGICHAHYSHYNVSSDARNALGCLFEVIAFLSELFVFAYLGLQVSTMSHSFDFGLIFSGIPLAVLSRYANVFPCTKLVNHYRRQKIPRRLQKMLWAVGLRGAVAYGLIVNMPRAANNNSNSNNNNNGDDSKGSNNDYGIPAIETAALLIVVVSTLLLGSATEPLLRYFELDGMSDEEVYRIGWEEEEERRNMDLGGGNYNYNTPAMGGGGSGGSNDTFLGGFIKWIVEISRGHGSRNMEYGGSVPHIDPGERSALHEKFKEIDDIYLKPLFGGRTTLNTSGINNTDDTYPSTTTNRHHHRYTHTRGGSDTSPLIDNNEIEDLMPEESGRTLNRHDEDGIVNNNNSNSNNNNNSGGGVIKSGIGEAHDAIVFGDDE